MGKPEQNFGQPGVRGTLRQRCQSAQRWPAGFLTKINKARCQVKWSGQILINNILLQ